MHTTRLVFYMCRFHTHNYVINAVCRHRKDVSTNCDRWKIRLLLRILWRENPSQTLEIYRLKTVTYGSARAPFLARQTLQQLAQDEESNVPRTSKLVTIETFTWTICWQVVVLLMKLNSYNQNLYQCWREAVLNCESGSQIIKNWSTTFQNQI